MAYFNQEMKKKIAPGIRKLLKEYGVKGSVGVRNYSTLVVNIKSGSLDFENDLVNNENYRGHIQVNLYWLDENWSGKSLEFLKKLKALMNDGNYDKSDLQSDYFDVGWYNDVNVGKWDKPYELTV